MKVAIVLGTRPEIIKMAPVIRALQLQKTDFFILHTGQHYTPSLDRLFFTELLLPEPKFNLNVGSGSHAKETAEMLVGIEKVLLEEKPDVALVEGDTNSVLAGALAAAKLNIKVGHIEAGLRSYDRSMPEEINRVVVDHLAQYLFSPTEKAKNILLGEGISAEQVFITGNTIVDSVYRNREIARKKSRIMAELGLSSREYFLVTIHRQENVDIADRLTNIFRGLELVFKRYSLPLIFPAHPRTQRRLKEFGLQVPQGLKLIEPVGFLDFLTLEANACLILTDSGGVQEEACILKVPCVTLRNNTERPETLEVCSNILAGADPERILESVGKMLSRRKDWSNPFGDGCCQSAKWDTF